MPTPTYDLIEEKVLGSAQASVTFSSIPGTYKDLVLEVVASASASGASGVYLQVGNGSVDTGSNYSVTVLNGTGTSATSARASNATFMYCNTSSMPTTEPATHFIQLMSYANTNVFKTVLYRANAATTANTVVRAGVNLWRSTSAINIITAYQDTSTFIAGSTFRLWGVSG